MPTPLFESTVAGREIRILATDRDDGDMRPDCVAVADLLDRQVSATGRPWVMLDEVHGVDVVDVGDRMCGAPMVGVGDVAVTDRSGVHLAVWTADCAPIFLLGDDGTVVGAHGGWRGLADGVVDVAVATARRNDAQIVAAVLGPVIGPCCYEFGADDLAVVAHGVHAAPADVSGSTVHGNLALDMSAAVRCALARHGVGLDVTGPCTGCDERWFSHRQRNDPGRHATVALIEAVVAP